MLIKPSLAQSLWSLMTVYPPIWSEQESVPFVTPSGAPAASAHVPSARFSHATPASQSSSSLKARYVSASEYSKHASWGISTPPPRRRRRRRRRLPTTAASMLSPAAAAVASAAPTLVPRCLGAPCVWGAPPVGGGLRRGACCTAGLPGLPPALANIPCNARATASQWPLLFAL